MLQWDADEIALSLFFRTPVLLSLFVIWVIEPTEQYSTILIVTGYNFQERIRSGAHKLSASRFQRIVFQLALVAICAVFCVHQFGSGRPVFMCWAMIYSWVEGLVRAFTCWYRIQQTRSHEISGTYAAPTAVIRISVFRSHVCVTQNVCARAWQELSVVPAIGSSCRWRCMWRSSPTTLSLARLRAGFGLCWACFSTELGCF